MLPAPVFFVKIVKIVIIVTIEVFGDMKSKVEVRKFAVEMAVAIMGKGTSDKDVVAKASEIEKYVIGEAELPEVEDETTMIGELLDKVMKSTQVK